MDVRTYTALAIMAGTGCTTKTGTIEGTEGNPCYGSAKVCLMISGNNYGGISNLEVD